MSRPHRLRATQYTAQHQYFLTICTYRRRPDFTNADIVVAVREEFLRTASAERFALLAYCFMPDHLHIVTSTLAAGVDLPRFVKLAKQRSGFQFARTAGGRLWQESFFDRTLREHENPATVVRYVIENPLRAGLAASPEAYPYWGSQVYSRAELLEYVAVECQTK